MQRRRKAWCASPDFTLADQAAFPLMHKLHRILDGNDVSFAITVDKVHHGRQRGGLPGPCWAGDQQQPFLFPAQRLEHRRQPEILQALHGAWNDAEYRAKAVQMAEDVDAKACQACGRIGIVNVKPLRKELGSRIGHRFMDERGGFLPCEFVILDG
jgi:hypothetical protein